MFLWRMFEKPNPVLRPFLLKSQSNCILSKASVFLEIEGILIPLKVYSFSVIRNIGLSSDLMNAVRMAFHVLNCFKTSLVVKLEEKAAYLGLLFAITVLLKRQC